jgi:hypothetical protein
MTAKTAYSFRRATETCYLDLLNIHYGFLSATADSRSRGGYALDTSAYLAPTPENLNRQVLSKGLMRTYATDSASLEVICSIIFDAALWTDYYAMARSEAQEQALQALASVLQQELQDNLPISPVLDGDLIKLSETGYIASYVEAQLNQVKIELDLGGHGAVFAAHNLLQRVSAILYVIKQAFKAAFASLLAFDMESVLHDLIQNEVLSELG